MRKRGWSDRSDNVSNRYLCMRASVVVRTSTPRVWPRAVEILDKEVRVIIRVQRVGGGVKMRWTCTATSLLHASPLSHARRSSRGNQTAFTRSA